MVSHNLLEYLVLKVMTMEEALKQIKPFLFLYFVLHDWNNKKTSQFLYDDISKPPSIFLRCYTMN